MEDLINLKPISFAFGQYFSSEEILCENCSHRTKGEQTTYFHAVITPMIAAPGNARMIALEPEFIVLQDGYEKQDCERAAGKRWLEQHGSGYTWLKATLLGDGYRFIIRADEGSPTLSTFDSAPWVPERVCYSNPNLFPAYKIIQGCVSRKNSRIKSF